jgi:cell division initiation protein
MQQIKPIEIRQKSFERSFRGYNSDEVDAFLHALAYAWEKIMQQLDEVKSALEVSDREIKRLQGIENALLRTIKDAEITACNITEQAQKEAELKARETKIETDTLIYETQKKIRAIEEATEKKNQHLKEQMTWELAKTKKMVQEAEVYRDALLQKLRHLAEDILAKSQLTEGSIQHNVDDNEDSEIAKTDMATTLSLDSEAAAVILASRL